MNLIINKKLNTKTNFNLYAIVNSTVKSIVSYTGLALLLTSIPVQAQVVNSNSKSGQYLSDRNGTESRNSKGSCDSTCSAMGSIAISSMESVYQQKVVPCGAGFTGNKVQQRSTDKDGNYSPWTDGATGQCVPL